jgi:NADH-quinone oxidoreductase subunit C
MDNDSLKLRLSELMPLAQFDEAAQWVTITVSNEGFKPLVKQLRYGVELDFDFLFCVTCVDWKTHLTMVYHLTSTLHHHTLAVKVLVDRNQPEIYSVSDIWRTAEFHEREAYDLFGVKFLDHPDLRRLFMTDDWQGWPLRKDYEDPVNMIKL